MIEGLFSGSSFRLDPTLTLLVPGTAFTFKKKESFIVTESGKLGFPENDIDIKYYLVQDMDRVNFRIMDDISANEIIIYREILCSRLDGEPPFVKEDKLNLELDGNPLEFVDVSGLMRVRIGNHNCLMHLYSRQLSNGEFEYLWCEIRDNKYISYFLGLNIHSSQVIF